MTESNNSERVNISACIEVVGSPYELVVWAAEHAKELTFEQRGPVLSIKTSDQYILQALKDIETRKVDAQELYQRIVQAYRLKPVW